MAIYRKYPSIPNRAFPLRALPERSYVGGAIRAFLMFGPAAVSGAESVAGILATGQAFIGVQSVSRSVSNPGESELAYGKVFIGIASASRAIAPLGELRTEYALLDPFATKSVRRKSAVYSVRRSGSST